MRQEIEIRKQKLSKSRKIMDLILTDYKNNRKGIFKKVEEALNTNYIKEEMQSRIEEGHKNLMY